MTMMPNFMMLMKLQRNMKFFFHAFMEKEDIETNESEDVDY